MTAIHLQSYALGWWDGTDANSSDHRFSTVLFKAADIDFHFWFRSISEELNYGIRYMTDPNELLNEFDDAPLLHRQMFLQFAALSMRDEGL